MEKSKILTGRLPPQDGSDWRETLGKRVSDDLQLSIFQLKKKIDAEKKVADAHFFSRTVFFLKIWPSKSG